MTVGHYLFLTGLLMAFITPQTHCTSLGGRKVVLMSMDGFRHDYLNKTDTPNFDSLIASGVQIPYVNNIFASLTFPSHHTIATGLYEESHGIVANHMFDPVLNASFKLGNVKVEWWNGAEPIWVNAVKSGLKVGTYYWPGTDVEINGYRPTKFRRYDVKVPFEKRVDTLIDDWLSKEDCDFGIIYFNEPDHSGHKYGPDAPELIPVIEKMDTLLGYFFEKLEKAKLKDKVDFIVTSDHGMTNIDRKNKIVVLKDHVNASLLYGVVGGGAFAQLRPQPGKARELVEALSGVEHIKAYLKEDIPDEYHHKNNRRIQPVLVVADVGWEVRKSSNLPKLKGNHGFPNDDMDMRPIFIAAGPSFKKGVKMNPIRTVDIYPLLCQLLKLREAPNNGSFENVKDFLVEAPLNAASSNIISIFNLLMTGLFSCLPFVCNKY